MKTVEEMLKEYTNISNDILKLNENLRIAVEAGLHADGCLKAMDMSCLPSKTNKVCDPVADNVENMFDNIEQISLELASLCETTKHQILEKMDLKKNIDAVWEHLTHEEKTIITLRYFDYPEPEHTWETVTRASHYSDSQCRRINRIALDKIVNILKDEQK